MAHRVEAAGERIVAVDGRDVAAWLGLPPAVDARDAGWAVRAAEYVDAHPRPADASSAGVAAAQRIALLRRLAAGPASRGDLLAAMRTVGWVGADDLENRLRDLRAGDSRAGSPHAGIPLRADGDRYWLGEPFPALQEADRRALGFAKGMLQGLDGPLPRAAAAALERLVPGLAVAPGGRTAVRYRATAGDYERFHAALIDRRPVRVRYFSLNSGRERTYDLVPVEYVTLGATVKAVCVEVTPFGRRAGEDRQLALDRLRAVEALPDRPSPPPEEIELRRADIVLDVSDGLYAVMRERNLFGTALTEGVPSDYDDTWRVRGTFPVALAWDVMEQLCAWAGNAQVHGPYWLVNAVCRRLRAGLRVMEAGEQFELVKPEPGRDFATHGDAVAGEALAPPAGPRRLAPPPG